MPKYITQNLRTLLESSKMTQAKISRETGINEVTVSRYVNSEGMSKPTAEIIFSFLKFIDNDSDEEKSIEMMKDAFPAWYKIKKINISKIKSITADLKEMDKYQMNILALAVARDGVSKAVLKEQYGKLGEEICEGFVNVGILSRHGDMYVFAKEIDYAMPQNLYSMIKSYVNTYDCEKLGVNGAAIFKRFEVDTETISKFWQLSRSFVEGFCKLIEEDKLRTCEKRNILTVATIADSVKV